jgi:hypothetical protein
LVLVPPIASIVSRPSVTLAVAVPVAYSPPAVEVKLLIAVTPSTRITWVLL